MWKGILDNVENVFKEASNIAETNEKKQIIEQKSLHENADDANINKSIFIANENSVIIEKGEALFNRYPDYVADIMLEGILPSGYRVKQSALGVLDSIKHTILSPSDREEINRMIVRDNKSIEGYKEKIKELEDDKSGASGGEKEEIQEKIDIYQSHIHAIEKRIKNKINEYGSKEREKGQNSDKEEAKNESVTLQEGWIISRLWNMLTGKTSWVDLKQNIIQMINEADSENDIKRYRADFKMGITSLKLRLDKNPEDKELKKYIAWLENDAPSLLNKRAKAIREFKNENAALHEGWIWTAITTAFTDPYNIDKMKVVIAERIKAQSSDKDLDNLKKELDDTISENTTKQEYLTLGRKSKKELYEFESWLKTKVPKLIEQRRKELKHIVKESSDWSDNVKTKYKPEAGLFKKDANTIANTLKDDSTNLKQSISRLNFYINRGGDELPNKRELEKAKDKLSAMYESSILEIYEYPERIKSMKFLKANSSIAFVNTYLEEQLSMMLILGERSEQSMKDEMGDYDVILKTRTENLNDNKKKLEQLRAELEKIRKSNQRFNEHKKLVEIENMKKEIAKEESYIAELKKKQGETLSKYKKD